MTGEAGIHPKFKSVSDTVLCALSNKANSNTMT